MPEAVRAEVFVVTGAMASGKSTVAEVLARRFDRSVHLRGDVFRKMIVQGRDPIGPELGPEALVFQDIYIGDSLSQVVADLETTPLYVVVLTPRPDVIARREREPSKKGYVGWDVQAFSEALERETPRIGLWLDTSDLTPEETVDQILTRLDDARVH